MVVVVVFVCLLCVFNLIVFGTSKAKVFLICRLLWLYFSFGKKSYMEFEVQIENKVTENDFAHSFLKAF